MCGFMIIRFECFSNGSNSTDSVVIQVHEKGVEFSVGCTSDHVNLDTVSMEYEEALDLLTRVVKQIREKIKEYGEEKRV